MNLDYVIERLKRASGNLEAEEDSSVNVRSAYIILQSIIKHLESSKEDSE